MLDKEIKNFETSQIGIVNFAPIKAYCRFNFILNMYKAGSTFFGKRRHIWGLHTQRNSTHIVPPLAKKGRVFWSTNRRSILVQKNLKGRFESAQKDETPLILMDRERTEKNGLQSSVVPESSANALGLSNENRWKNFDFLHKPKKSEKNLLADRPKPPEKFFSLPNMSKQDIDEVKSCHSKSGGDMEFFYVDRPNLNPKNASAVLHNFFFFKVYVRQGGIHDKCFSKIPENSGKHTTVNNMF